jgi:hypothetical protein
VVPDRIRVALRITIHLIFHLPQVSPLLGPLWPLPHFTILNRRHRFELSYSKFTMIRNDANTDILVFQSTYLRLNKVIRTDLDRARNGWAETSFHPRRHLMSLVFCYWQ